MELSRKCYKRKQVPWFSSVEWKNVYEQIYSNNTVEQTKAFKTILVWKARMPKLPMGVEGTLAILQVCLLDLEWTSMIDNGQLPMYREYVLSLMYSTTIMKVLNHLTAIGQMKQKSLFKVAKQLEIPSWIVSLRHNAAHGQEVTPLGLLRLAINLLLEWLHEEYWAVEAERQKFYIEQVDIMEEEEASDNTTLRDLVELWTSVNLYIYAGFQLASEIPDKRLWLTLRNLENEREISDTSEDSNSDKITSANNIKSDKEYNLITERNLLLNKITVFVTKEKVMSDVLCDILCENKIFLPDSGVMNIFEHERKNETVWEDKFLSLKMLRFWEDIIMLLHAKKKLGTLLYNLLVIMDEESEYEKRKITAALWINTIIHSFVQLHIAQTVCSTMEYKLSVKNKTLRTRNLIQRVKEHIHFCHPYLQNTLWFDISSTIPSFLSVNFVSELLLHVNEFSTEIIHPFLKLIAPRINAQKEEHLLKLFDIYTLKKYNDEDDSQNTHEKIFTVDDLRKNLMENETQAHRGKHNQEKIHLADQSIRNSHWQLVSDTYNWAECPIGLLPWQDSLKSLEQIEFRPRKKCIVPTVGLQIIPGTVNSKKLKMESRIDWDGVLWNRSRKKRKLNEDEADVIMNIALEVAKKRK